MKEVHEIEASRGLSVIRLYAGIHSHPQSNGTEATICVNKCIVNDLLG